MDRPNYHDCARYLRRLLDKPLPMGRGFQQQHYKEIQTWARKLADMPPPAV